MQNDDLLFKIVEFIKPKTENDHTGHDFNHLQRVAKLAEKIAKQEGCIQLKIILTSAYLHDFIDDKLVYDVEKNLMILKNRLREWLFTEDEINEIVDIITHMSFSKNLKENYYLSFAGQIVQDADRLDAIGAIGIARALTYGGVHKRVLYDPSISPRTNLTKEQYRNEKGTTINHFYEKLLLIKDQLNTTTAKQIAIKRQQEMLDFLNNFKLEWEGKA